MRRKVLAILVTVVMLVGSLAGCGNQKGSDATNTGQMESEGVHTEAHTTGGNSSSSAVAEETAEPTTTPEVVATEKPASRPIAVPTTEPEVPKVTLDNLSGIIAAYLYYNTSEPDFPMARIYSIDPVTGEATLVNDFGKTKSGSTIFFDTCYDFPLVGYTDYKPNFRRCFSDDFRKMAVTMGTKVTTEFYGDSHAGWLDENGNFHNVITALGWETKSEFDEPVIYQSVGFMDDGRLLFLRRRAGGGVDRYFAVPTDNMTEAAIEEFVTIPLAKPYILVDEMESLRLDFSSPSVKASVTDQLDEMHFLCNQTYYPQSSMLLNASVSILDIETGEITECVSGDGMATWCGIVDPTGTQIVFFAASPKNTASTSAIYTMPLDASSSPQKLDSNYVVNYPHNLHFELGFKSSYSILLDWR